MDAFFASVEQRDKPSLRGKPVIVAGIGGRGVVSTASYEARVFGVRSAMPTHEARRRCPHAAFLAVRFGAYRAASRLVMTQLRALSPLVEPLSLDEAFVDLTAAAEPVDPDRLTDLVHALKDRVYEVTGGLTCSVGVGSSKFIAKVATELNKPDGVTVIAPGSEVATIAPMAVGIIPGVGPVTRERLARLGVRTVADLQQVSEAELIRELGRAAGTNLHALAYARDDRRVEAEREAKSISVEDTFVTDLTSPVDLAAEVDRHAEEVARRLRTAQLFARTITIKVKLADFSQHTRSRTFDGATDRTDTIAAAAQELLATSGIDLGAGVRLLGVGVSGLTGVGQDVLFDRAPSDPTPPTVNPPTASPAPQPHPGPSRLRRPTPWLPGADVHHDEYGPGWVWGAGRGRVTVRFETAETGPGKVRTFALDDPHLRLADPGAGTLDE